MSEKSETLKKRGFCPNRPNKLICQAGEILIAQESVNPEFWSIEDLAPEEEPVTGITLRWLSHIVPTVLGPRELFSFVVLFSPDPQLAASYPRTNNFELRPHKLRRRSIG